MSDNHTGLTQLKPKDQLIVSPKQVQDSKQLQTASRSIKNGSSSHQIHFPSIKTSKQTSQQKINLIRNQTSKAKENVQLIKARIHALQKQKEKNDKQKEWALEQMEFLRSIRKRVDQDKQKKNEIIKNKELENIYLKKKAIQLKKITKSNRQLSLSLINQKKIEDYHKIKRQQKQHQLKLKEYNEFLTTRNKIKVKQIKIMQSEMESKRKKYEYELLKRASENHKTKLSQQLNNKTSVHKTLQKISNDQEIFLSQLKLSQNKKLNSFKNLYQLINPEKPDTQQRRSVYSEMYKKVFNQSQKRLIHNQSYIK